MSATQSRGQTGDVCPKPRSKPDGFDRWELLKLVEDLRKQLNLNLGDIMVLRAHLTVLPDGRLRPGELNLSFMQVKNILGRALKMDERRFREGETRLHKAGLVRRRLSSNYRRFPERDACGKIIGGYGIDLNPLIDRRAELISMHQETTSKRRVLRQKFNKISARFHAFVRDVYGIGADLPAHVAELKKRMRNTMRRSTTTIEVLEALEIEVTKIEVTEVGAAPCPAVAAASAAEKDQTPVSEEEDHCVEYVSSARQQPTQTGVDDGGIIRHIESRTNKENLERDRTFEPRSFSLAWMSTKTLRAFYPDPPRREQDAAGVLFEFSSYLGLGQQVVIKALQVFGWEKLIQVVDYLAERIDRLRHPQGYLGAMIKCFERGEPVAGGSVQPVRLPRNRYAA